MPTPATLLVTATLLPLVSFVILMFFGKRIGNPLAGWLGTAFIAGSFVCSMGAMMAWLGRDAASPWGAGIAPINLPFKWIPVGAGVNQDHPGYLDIGIYVDSLTIVMFAMVTLVSTLVHIFSIGYMHEDKRFPRFFTYLGLFCFSMLGLVLGGTTLQLFIFWELVGLCSYLLIGFWYEKKSASNAAIKAFVTNRVGDFGFLIGFGILFYHLGNVTLPHMWTALGTAGQGGAVSLAGGTVFSPTLLTVMGIGLFFGAIGKSAQFPLHVWLPDAMEGPTPVSALIHAATMVAAGVYLVGRIFPILTPDAKLFIALIGCTTLTMAALIAVAQTDIKKVLAYSTLSQLGYMILAMGVGSWVGGLFHLITHAFFKALLFLGSGSVIHAAHHEQELPQYGGLIRKIPVTGITFLIAVFAIAGFGIAGWGFAGFYSKDMILMHAGAFGLLSEGHGHPALKWFFYLPVIIAYVTPFYMMRCWMLTFMGKPRNQHLYDHAHESPMLYLPLIVLAILSVIGGKYLNVKEMLEQSVTETTNYCRTLTNDPSFRPFATAWPADPPHAETPEAVAALPHTQHVLHEGEHLMHQSVGWAWLVGMGAGFLIYLNGFRVANAVLKVPGMRAVNTWLYRRMYFDELYFTFFVGTTVLLAKVSRAFDTHVIDRIVNLVGGGVRSASRLAGLNDRYVVDGSVNGISEIAQGLGAAVRAPQTGRIRVYVMVLLGCVGLALAAAILTVVALT